MKRQGPELIKDVKARYGLTQKDLEKVLNITQQAVSDYELGKVGKERYDVIQKLIDMLAGRIDDTLRKILENKGLESLIPRSPAQVLRDTSIDQEVKKRVEREIDKKTSGIKSGSTRRG